MTFKIFLKNLLYIGLFLILLVVLALVGLRMYTNHGQKLDLPEFIGMNIDDASDEAEKKSFQIIVNDSVHIVGKPGGLITDQNPKPNSQVKENRKIYVTITKYTADVVTVKSLPTLYGRDYDRKRKELAYMNLNTRIKDYKYDTGEANHILEVYYDGKLIVSRNSRNDDVKLEKGGTLEFVLSKRQGGQIPIPDFSCMDVEAAKFLIENLKLKVGNITGKVVPGGNSYVTAQSPIYNPSGTIEIGQQVDITIVNVKPKNCP